MSDISDILRALQGRGSRPTLDDVPPVESEAAKAAYSELASRLYGGLDGPPEERARSVDGQIAALLWQRVAEWEDAAESDET